MSNDEQSQAFDLSLDDLIPPGFGDDMEFPEADDEHEPVVEEVTSEEMKRGGKLFGTCMQVYKGMHDRSVVTHEGRVYKGRVSSLFGEIGVSLGTYSPVMKRLNSMGCIDQLVRGGGGKPSIYILYNEPTQGAFEASRNGGYISKDRATVTELQMIVTLLSQRVGQLEAQVANLVEWRHQETLKRDHANKVLAYKDAIQPNAKGL